MKMHNAPSIKHPRHGGCTLIEGALWIFILQITGRGEMYFGCGPSGPADLEMHFRIAANRTLENCACYVIVKYVCKPCVRNFNNVEYVLKRNHAGPQRDLLWLHDGHKWPQRCSKPNKNKKSNHTFEMQLMTQTTSKSL